MPFVSKRLQDVETADIREIVGLIVTPMGKIVTELKSLGLGNSANPKGWGALEHVAFELKGLREAVLELTKELKNNGKNS